MIRKAFVATVAVAAVAVMAATLTGGSASGAATREGPRFRDPGGAPAPAGDSAAAPQPDRTIRVVERYTGPFTEINVGEPEFLSPGDYGVYQDPVFDASNRTRVGTLVAQDTVIAGGTLTTEGTLTLSGRGKITYAGPNQLDASTADYPITGGQGEFRAVRGEVHVDYTGESQPVPRAVFTFKIVD